MKKKEIAEIKRLSSELYEIEWITKFDNELNVPQVMIIQKQKKRCFSVIENLIQKLEKNRLTN